jgi:hypothetical protein
MDYGCALGALALEPSGFCSIGVCRLGFKTLSQGKMEMRPEDYDPEQ